MKELVIITPVVEFEEGGMVMLTAKVGLDFALQSWVDVSYEVFNQPYPGIENMAVRATCSTEVADLILQSSYIVLSCVDVLE